MFDYDLCVIGGGINGVGIARDAAGRGLSVLLVEARDLASATSSSSTKLIHGGLRYLEYFEFRLVRESLKEREVLLSAAPHIIRPLEFVLPHDQNQRPAWMIRLGLFLYDRLGGRKKLQASAALDLEAHDYGRPLLDKYKAGFSYADCRVDDARLVVLNAMDAAEKGAEISTHTACTHLACEPDHWTVSLRDLKDGKARTVKAAMVINAAGPWVRGVLEASDLAPDGESVPNIRLVKGSHIIVPRRYKNEQAYIVQQKDKRIVFVIPYEGKFTLIGTTEENYEGDPADAIISKAEVTYLCDAYNGAFKNKIKASDVACSYSGVRPLFNEGGFNEDGFDEGGKNATAVSRDYKLYYHRDMSAPMLSIFGGKLTTYRVLAEEAVSRILKVAGRPGAAWTAAHALPGGDIVDGDFDAFVKAQGKKYAWLPQELLQRYARSYGTRMDRFLNGSKALEELGQDFGQDGNEYIFEAEIVYLVRFEWARDVEDILWRRSKLGLHVSPATAQNLAEALPEIVKEHGDE